MAGLIPQHFIDDLLDRADIVDVVGSRLSLRKSGKNYSACCPFHDEKTPSFTVSPDKQFYYCFGCGAGGNSLGFLMDFDHIGFVDAVEDLAKRLGLEVPREEGGNNRQQQNKPIYALLEQAGRFYRKQLRTHSNASQAVNYLKNRGLTGKIAGDFGLGYAPDGWSNLMDALGDAGGDNRLLEQAGLMIENPDSNRSYDRFRNRIMFPIRDVRGRIIGFGGRVLNDEKPKYLNSPETPVFHKGRELYGLYEANQALRDLPNVIMVEGYMDVVALAQFDIRNAVATLGTAATEAHLEKAFRYTSEIVFCFDGDAAGRKAAKRVMETALPVMIDGRSAKFLFLPDGEDPDTMVRKLGKEGFLAEVASATSLSEFLFNSLTQDIDMQSMDGRARLSKLAAPLINRMPEGVFQELMYKRLASLTDVDQQKLREIIAPPEEPAPPVEQHETPDDNHWDYPELQGDDFARNDYDYPAAVEARPKKTVKLSSEKLLIALLLNNPHFATRLGPDLMADLQQNKGLELFLQLCELLQANPEYTINHVLGYWRGVYDQQQAEVLAQIAATDILHPSIAGFRDDASEFDNILGSLIHHSQKYLPAEELLVKLAAQESVTKKEIRQANSAWVQLVNTELGDRAKELHAKILAKPQHGN